MNAQNKNVSLFYRYSADLAALSASASQIASSVAPANPWPAREPLLPLEARLQRLLDELPDDVKQAGIPIAALAERLRGRAHGQAHRGELGAALRALGWRRVRCWRQEEDGFRAYWYPPTPQGPQHP